MKHFRISAAFVLLAALALSLGACMNTAQEPAATLAPGARNTAAATTAPGASFMPEATEDPAGAVSAAQPFDWRANEAKVEERINQISEISESRVVVAGTTALVGVKFASAYKGEMTERIREMIAGVVREADPSVQTVAVTAEQGDVDKVYGYADQIQSGKDGESLAEDINRIVRNITTMR